MVKICFTILIMLFQNAAHADLISCSKEQIRSADLEVLNQFGQEALRFIKIKMNLYPKWTGPYDSKLLEVCEAAVKASQKAGEGSAIFIGLDSDLYQTLARSTNSWVSHTGLLFKEDNNWVVYESKAPHGPKEPTPICDFIRRSADYRFAITKVRKELSTSQIQVLRDIAAKESVHNYDFSFDIENQKNQFCSKLTYTAYQSLGLEFGKVQSLGQILEDYQGPEQERQRLACFWMAWTGAAKIISKRQLSIFDWSQQTLTPASQYQQAIEGLNNPEIPFVLVHDSNGVANIRL